jgi:hypothetical protein
MSEEITFGHQLAISTLVSLAVFSILIPFILSAIRRFRYYFFRDQLYQHLDSIRKRIDANSPQDLTFFFCGLTSNLPSIHSPDMAKEKFLSLRQSFDELNYLLQELDELYYKNHFALRADELVSFSFCAWGSKRLYISWNNSEFKRWFENYTTEDIINESKEIRNRVFEISCLVDLTYLNLKKTWGSELEKLRRVL